MPEVPPVSGLLETALYVADMPRSARFFREVLQLRPMIEGDRLTAFDAGRSGVLLLFLAGASLEDMPGSGGVIPGHDGSGPVHMAFAIPVGSEDAWRAHLAAQGVPLRSEVAWPRGGRSLYFDDPDGHVLELATPGLWPNY
ncbi:VOC family protein [Sphingomonas sp. ac-8]|uniref:VOC family protein n=1 Tax=Sphingomonas sp. ac-8 TaxID=3242977 RepID=UPI003A80199D